MGKVSCCGVRIIVPEDIRGPIRLPPDEIEDRLRVELALRLYAKRIVSFGVARRIAGLTKWEFIELLARERILFHYDEASLQEDLEWLKE